MSEVTLSNGLTEAQLERLVVLAEECGEVIQEVSKIVRFGYESYHPHEPQLLNRDRLEREIGNVRAIIRMMIFLEDIDEFDVNTAQINKGREFHQYARHTVVP